MHSLLGAGSVVEVGDEPVLIVPLWGPATSVVLSANVCITLSIRYTNRRAEKIEKEEKRQKLTAFKK